MCLCSLFLDKEEDNVIQLSSLEDAAAAAETPEQLHAVYKRFVNFHGELLLMVHWSILAYTGLVKILKKHHKRTGLLVRAPHLDNLLSQPFCSIEVSTLTHAAVYSCCPSHTAACRESQAEQCMYKTLAVLNMK